MKPRARTIVGAAFALAVTVVGLVRLRSPGQTPHPHPGEPGGAEGTVGRAALVAASRPLASAESRGPPAPRDERNDIPGAVDAAGQPAAASESPPRDPEKEFVLVDRFENVGRTTPSAAFQTALWAAMKGEEAVLRDTLTLDSAARKKAEEVLARLPPAAREKYPTPESLAALVWMWIGENTHGMAYHVVGTTQVDAQQAIVRTRSAGSEMEGAVPMQLAPGGWRLVVAEGVIDAFRRRMSAMASEPPAKK